MKKVLCLLCLVMPSILWASENHVYSLRGEVAIEDSSVSVVAKEWQDGEGKIMKNYVQQPPLIPHDISGFAINRDGNTCLSCHNWNAEMPSATKVGVSHFINREGKALAEISVRRYFCTQCHVMQKNAPPLLKNLFKPLVQE